MFKKSIFIAVFSFLLLLPLSDISAQSIDIFLNGQTFGPGDEVEVKTSFTNPVERQLKGRLVCGFIALNPGLPPMPSAKEFDLAPGEKTESFVFGMEIKEWMPAGLYRAEIKIYDEENVLVTKENKEFSVTGTKKNIEANVDVCVDRDCSERKVVFIRDETVYLKLNSDTQNLDITATLKTPGGEIKNITFRDNAASYSLKNADEGNYSLWVKLSRKGYLDVKIEENFAVLNAAANIPSASKCNANGKCEDKENVQNCPQDCSPKKTEDGDNSSFILVVASLIALVMGVAIFILVKKKRKIAPK